MSKNMPTTKEVELIADLLLLEESLCKKAKLYSNITMNTKLKEQLETLSQNHKERFMALYSLL